MGISPPFPTLADLIADRRALAEEVRKLDARILQARGELRAARAAERRKRLQDARAGRRSVDKRARNEEIVRTMLAHLP